MPINSNYTTPASGANTAYQVVTSVMLDYLNKRTVAQVASYVSADTYTAGKASVFSQQAMIKSMPPSGSDPLAFVESLLVAPDATVDLTAFSGGTIAGSTASTTTTPTASSTADGTATPAATAA